MVVLQVMSCIEYGGTEAFVYNQSKKLLKQHSDIRICLMICGTYINELRKKDFEELGIPIYMSSVPSVGNSRTIYHDLERILQQEKIDVIHCHMNLGSFVVIHQAKRLGIPVRIAHSHDTKGFSGNPIRRMEQKIRVAAMRSDATELAACSRDAGSYLFGRKFLETGCVIPNGIEADAYGNCDRTVVEQLKKEYNLEGKYIIGNITRFEEKKNQRFLLEVFQELSVRMEDAVLVLGGVDAGMEEEIKKTAMEKGLSEKVRFIGVRKDLPAWMELLDLWVMPSLFEGLGIVLVEAQFSGLYCLASDQVSKEADCGYGMIEFLPLEKQIWTERIEAARRMPQKYTEEELRQKNASSHFNLDYASRILYELYRKSL